jgi:hypothetical protein
VSVWDFVNDISQDKRGIYTEENKKDYNAFLINRAFSMYPDTILNADEMNCCRNLDTRLQYDYYLHSVRAKKRYGSKWPKKQKDEDLDFLCTFFNFSREKARVAMSIMNETQLEELKKKTDRGGVK